MRKVLAAEFYKTKGKKLWLIIIFLVCIELIWAIFSSRSLKGDDLQFGWQFTFMGVSMLNCIIMPIVSAVMASRLCDAEHKGQTLKMLETILPCSKIFHAKFICGASYLFFGSLLQAAGILAIGIFKRFDQGRIPLLYTVYFIGVTCLINVTLYLIQQVLSLVFINQLIPLTIGLIGAFLGIMSNFFSGVLGRILIWGYYTYLSPIQLTWIAETDDASYYWTPIAWNRVLLLPVILLIVYFAGRIAFQRKEI